MRNAIEIFRSRPTFGDVASAAGHDIGARNAIEFFSSRPSFGDVASAASHDIGARETRLKFFEVDQRLEMLRVPLVTILARGMRLKVFQLYLGQTANNVTSRARKISLKFVEKMSIFNRMYRANIVTSGPRSTSKACFVKKPSIAFLALTS